MKTETEAGKAVKWEANCVASGCISSESGEPRHIADCYRSSEIARQIVREHNAFPALVEALQELMEDTFECYCADGVAVKGACGYCKAQAALALAKEP